MRRREMPRRRLPTPEVRVETETRPYLLPFDRFEFVDPDKSVRVAGNGDLEDRFLVVEHIDAPLTWRQPTDAEPALAVGEHRDRRTFGMREFDRGAADQRDGFAVNVE